MEKELYFKIFVGFSVFGFVACSNSQESKLAYTETATVKQAVIEKEADISWTNELEPDRLTKSISKHSMQLGADVVFDKDLFKISRNKQAPVYPSLSDFGSLDTSRLQPGVKNKVNTFCEQLSSNKNVNIENFFNSKYIFNFVFFQNDLKEGWKKNFNKDFPKEAALFKKWIFGEPFNGADIIQIPVRFYTDYGTIDVVLFLNSSGNNDFYQITIDRWQKYDGRR